MFGMGAGVAPEDQLDRSQTRRVLRRVLRMAYPFRKTAYVALGCVVVTTAATLAAPILVRHGIDAGIRANDVFELNLSVGLYLHHHRIGIRLRASAVRVFEPHR